MNNILFVIGNHTETTLQCGKNATLKHCLLFCTHYIFTCKIFLEIYIFVYKNQHRESNLYKPNMKSLLEKIAMKNDSNRLYKYLYYLNKGKIITLVASKTRGDNIFTKPEKIYLSNTNLHYAYCTKVEIGGKNKTKKQIKNIDNAYIVLDDIEIGGECKIPLWFFGFYIEN